MGVLTGISHYKSVRISPLKMVSQSSPNRSWIKKIFVMYLFMISTVKWKILVYILKTIFCFQCPPSSYVSSLSYKTNRTLYWGQLPIPIIWQHWFDGPMFYIVMSWLVSAARWNMLLSKSVTISYLPPFRRHLCEYISVHTPIYISANIATWVSNSKCLLS